MHNVPRSLITETLVKSKLFSENKKRKDYLKNKITLVKKIARYRVIHLSELTTSI